MAWEQLLSILQEAGAYQQEEKAPPTACPNDGEPLQVGPGGVLFCKFDGYRYEGGGV